MAAPALERFEKVRARASVKTAPYFLDSAVSLLYPTQNRQYTLPISEQTHPSNERA